MNLLYSVIRRGGIGFNKFVRPGHGCGLNGNYI